MARYGLVAKGISYGLVGVLAVAVAVSGTGKATRNYGAVLLFVVAAGLVCYGLFSFVEARYRRV
jgi:hypothetical protein